MHYMPKLPKNYRGLIVDKGVPRDDNYNLIFKDDWEEDWQERRIYSDEVELYVDTDDMRIPR